MQWSLYAGNRKLGASFKWSMITLYRWSLERSLTSTWSLRTGGRVKMVVVKTGLAVETVYKPLKQRTT